MRMHDDQVVVDLPVVRRLVSNQFPTWRDLAITPVAGDATVNAIFRIGDAYAARFLLRAADLANAAALLRAEVRAMSEFATVCPVPTPQPVAVGRPADGYPGPWPVQTWVPGTVATPAGLADSAAFADDLARLVLALRSADTRGRTFDRTGRGGHLPDHDGWIATCLSNSRGMLDTERLAALWERLRELPRSGPDVMTHGDLTPPNLLVDGDRLVAVLDAGGFGAADPALDLVGAWHLLDLGPRHRFRRRLDCDDVEWARGAAWAFEQALGLVWYYRNTNPGMSALGRSTLTRILSDPGITAG